MAPWFVWAIKGNRIMHTCMYTELFLNVRQSDSGEQFGPWASCHIDHHHFAASLKQNHLVAIGIVYI